MSVADSPQTSACCDFNRRFVARAGSVELRVLRKAFVRGSLVLGQDAVLGGELVQKGSRLRQVDKLWRYDHQADPGENYRVARQALKQYIDAEESARIVFLIPRMRCPWCCTLHYPCCLFIGVIACAVSIVVTGVVKTGAPVIDTNFDSFMSSDGQASLQYDAILLALEDRKSKKSNGDGRRLQASEGRRLKNLYSAFTLEVTYVSPGTSILTRGKMDRVHRNEQKMRTLSSWKDLCDKSYHRDYRLCAQGTTISNFAYPLDSYVGQDTYELFFNGSGHSMLPLDIAIGLAREEGLIDLVFPKKQAAMRNLEIEGLPCADRGGKCARFAADGQCKPYAKHEAYMRDFCAKTCGFCGPVRNHDASDPQTVPPAVVDAVRSFYTFRVFCCTTKDSDQAGKLQQLNDQWLAFIADLIDHIADWSDDVVHIYYKGDKIEGFEAMQAVKHDLLYALGAYAFVLFYATLHTRSVFLSVTGLCLVMLSIPSALGIFQIVSGSTSISLMSCLSIFIVVGIGSDMVFVYTDFWKQSLSYSRSPMERLKYTYKQAATSTAATTFTTAMSFLANLASVLRPLREFGFFMGMCVIMAWLIIFFGYPPMLVVGERCHRRLRSCLMGHQQTVPPPGSRRSRKSFVQVARATQRGSALVAGMLDPEKKGVGEVHKNCLGKFASVLHNMRVFVFVGFLLLTGVFMFMAATQMEQDPDIPKIFQSDHNQVAGKAYDSLFSNFDSAIEKGAKSKGKKCSNMFQDCDFHWCRTLGRAVGSPMSCKCSPFYTLEDAVEESQRLDHLSPMEQVDAGLRRPRKPVRGCGSELRVRYRVVGSKGMPKNAIVNENILDLARMQYPDAVSVKLRGGHVSASMMIVRNWETGQEDLVEVFVLPDVSVQFPPKYKDMCHQPHHVVCYCGVERCEGSTGGVGYGNLQLVGNLSRRLLSPIVDNGEVARRLEDLDPQPKIRPENRIDVILTFGIDVTGTNPLLGQATQRPYEFNSELRLDDPWAQRNLLDVCQDMVTNKTRNALKISTLSCWVTGFKSFWVRSGEDWPVRLTKDFHRVVHDYSTAHTLDGKDVSTYIWFSSRPLVKATFIRAILSRSKHLPSGEALEIMYKWDEYVNTFNANAPSSITGAVHGSRLWVRAEAEKVILDSTIITLGISLGCVFLGVVVFTCSVHLALIVMTAVAAIIVCLLFFMVVLKGWKIGAIEVLSLIVFVGFAVDYCLHVAHKYHSCHIDSVHVSESQSSLLSETVESASPASAQFCADGDQNDCLAMQETPSDSLTLNGRIGANSSHRTSRRSSCVSVQFTMNDVNVADPDRSTRAGKLQNTASSDVLDISTRNEERFSRASYALERMGGAVVGSALTTVGSAAFLLPCQLAIFTKIGAVVMAVTFFAIVYALLPLPALLMICGPCEKDFATCRGAALGLLEVAPRPGKLPAAIPKAAAPSGVEGPATDRTSEPFAGTAEEKEGQHSSLPEETSMRRYVLHMPSKTMTQCGADTSPVRTRINATG